MLYIHIYLKLCCFKRIDLDYYLLILKIHKNEKITKVFSYRFGGRYLVIGWTSTPLAGGGRGAGADHNTANSVPTNLIMMKGAKVLLFFFYDRQQELTLTYYIMSILAKHNV